MKLKPSHVESVLTVKETAKYLRISEMTVLRLVNQGGIPGTKIGRQWRFSAQAILDLLKHPDIFAAKVRS